MSLPPGVPRHKGVPGTSFVVDGFKFGRHATVAFLTHGHSDHYTGLDERWLQPIYCTTITASLMVMKLGVDRSLMRIIEPGQTVVVDSVEVSAIDANHCPGAVQFLFRLPDNQKFIHSGDTRFCESMKENELLRQFRGARILYLDTTYCNPRHTFPDQGDSIRYVVDTVLKREREKETSGKRALYLISSYTIGKERIFVALIEATGKKIYANKAKIDHLELLRIPALTAALTDDPKATNVHLCKWDDLGEVWPYFRPNFAGIEEYREKHGADEVVGFVPTGHVYNKKGKENEEKNEAEEDHVQVKCRQYACPTSPVTVHFVPYSEHSSFDELVDFVSFIRPEQVIPTVNVGETDKMLRHFKGLTDENSAKRRFLQAFGKPAGPPAVKKEEEEEEEEGEEEETVQEEGEGPLQLLMAATGVTASEASVLLKRSNGSAERAASLFFETKANPPQPLARAAPVKKAKRSSGQLSLSSFFASKTAAPSPAATSAKPRASPVKLGGGIQIQATPPTPPPMTQEVLTSLCDKELGAYDPEKDAPWAKADPCPYLFLAQAFEMITKTKKRLLINRILVNMFRSIFALSPESLVHSVYLTVGTLGPEFASVNLGIGGATVSSCVCEVLGVSRQRLRQAYKDEGDLGDVACLFKQSQQTLVPLTPLTVSSTHAKLMKLAEDSGGGSSTRKAAVAKALIRGCRGPETRYMVRTLLQCMRIGASRTMVLQAMARASVFHHQRRGSDEGGGSGAQPVPAKEALDAAVTAFERVYRLCPDIEVLGPDLVSKGIDYIADHCAVRPGIPIVPMLAKPSKGIEDAAQLMEPHGAFLCEYKYDGQRAQIHYEEGEGIRIFSRNLEEKTQAFPDACDLLREALDLECASLVIDCEIVGIDHSKGDQFRLLSFQELSTRPRGEVGEGSGAKAGAMVSVALFAFDIMYLNGQSLVDLPLRERLRELERALPGRQKGKVMIATSVQVNPASPKEEAEGESQGTHSAVVDSTKSALLESIQAGCEGVMLKPLGSPYEPGKRSDHWIKLKKDYCEGMQDSLDLVPIGAWWGNGRKAGWYSPYLLAAWDSEREEFQSVCRVMSGFSDEFYKETKAYFDEHLIDGPKPYFNTGESCSVWFEPTVVWEIRGADISVSPVHRAAVGKVHPSRGLALRFPRFIRKRPDKSPEEASTGDQVAEMFQAQAVHWKGKGGTEAGDKDEGE